MRLLDRFLVPGLFIVFILVMSCVGDGVAPYSPPPQGPLPPSLPNTPAPIPTPTIDISGCTTVLCCPDCLDMDIDRIIDGDTFASANARIRLFGIDTPERGEKCFNEATDRLREIAGDIVLLERGPRAEDQYGRQLFYIYTEGGESVDEILVREGLATAWKRDGQHRDALVLAEEEAQRDGRGCLWQPGI